MSAASEQDRLNPNHPLYYAPRRSSERPELRPVPSQETTAERAGRPGSSAISLDTELENAVSEALRKPLDPAVIRKAPGPFGAQNFSNLVLKCPQGVWATDATFQSGY